MKKSFVQMTTETLRSRGWDYEIVQHRIVGPGGKHRSRPTINIDFAGFADILAWKSGHAGVLAINVCGSDVFQHTARYKDPTFTRGRRKQVVRERILRWIDGNRFEIWSWQQAGGDARIPHVPELIVFRAKSEDGRRLNFPQAENNLETDVLF